MLSLAIYTNKKIDKALVQDIRSAFVSNVDSKIFDFFIFSDDIKTVTNYDFAILSTFYMEFYKDYLIFTDLDDYLSYKDRLLTQHNFLYAQNISTLPDHTDRNLLKEFMGIFTNNNNTISMVRL